MTKNIIMLLGPNLNMVGVRDQGIYGKESAEAINKQVEEYAQKNKMSITIFQSNIEGELINKIHQAKGNFSGGIINAGALSHYSYALHDAIECVNFPFVEVHMSNIFSREDFRHKSVLSPVCAGLIAGFGKESYFLAINALKELM